MCCIANEVSVNIFVETFEKNAVDFFVGVFFEDPWKNCREDFDVDIRKKNYGSLHRYYGVFFIKLQTVKIINNNLQICEFVEGMSRIHESLWFPVMKRATLQKQIFPIKLSQ